MKPDSQGSTTRNDWWRLDNRRDIQQMRAQPATSKVCRPAAQLVAYGGSLAGSMREGAHPGRIAAYPAQETSHQATHTCETPSVTHRRRVARQATTREPIIQEPDSFDPEAAGSTADAEAEPEAARRAAGVAESSRA